MPVALRTQPSIISYLTITLIGLANAAPASETASWQHYGSDEGGTHFSALAQITTENASQLTQVWAYSTGENSEYPERKAMSGFNGTPLILPQSAGQSLVLCSAFNRIIALDPETGTERWIYDPEIDLGPVGDKYLCRGIAYWEDAEASTETACKHRLFMGTKDLRLISIDATNGKTCNDFGDHGEQSLRSMIVGDITDIAPGDLQFSAPPVVVADTVIIGFSDNTKFWRADNPSGAVHAFDARTGTHRWSFDPVPRNLNDPEAEGWTDASLEATGGANVWTMMSVDSARGLVFLPTATAGPNYIGIDRPGDNRYANSVVALNATDGKVVWHFQTLHHDVWDLDLPAQPILADIQKDGQNIPVVIQLTKQGLVFVLHRETGVPVFPVEERPVPTDGIPGEVLSPTQPFPLMPKPLGKIGISPEDAWGFSVFDRTACRNQIEKFRLGGLYEPVGLQGTLSMPGLSINNWGGGAYDPSSNLLVVPISQTPKYLRLWITDEIPPEVMNKPRMGPLGPPTPIAGTPYAYEMAPLLSPIMTPCTPPPWGELAAIDMNDGSIRWRRTIGTLDKLSRTPLPLEWGTPLAGGPTSTASGVTFIGATADEKFRAFNTRTGELLWEAPTPSAAMATPMTYEVNGRQYVAVAAGGHLFMYGQNISDYLVAFALPELTNN